MSIVLLFFRNFQGGNADETTGHGCNDRSVIR
jgi:hypothetical protein